MIYIKEQKQYKYLHSHTLQEIILNCISDHKSYISLKEKHDKGDKNIKGLVQKIEYKAKIEGKEVIIIEEKYT